MKCTLFTCVVLLALPASAVKIESVAEEGDGTCHDALNGDQEVLQGGHPERAATRLKTGGREDPFADDPALKSERNKSKPPSARGLKGAEGRVRVAPVQVSEAKEADEHAAMDVTSGATAELDHSQNPAAAGSAAPDDEPPEVLVPPISGLPKKVVNPRHGKEAKKLLSPTMPVFKVGEILEIPDLIGTETYRFLVMSIRDRWMNVQLESRRDLVATVDRWSSAWKLLWRYAVERVTARSVRVAGEELVPFRVDRRVGSHDQQYIFYPDAQPEGPFKMGGTADDPAFPCCAVYSAVRTTDQAAITHPLGVWMHTYCIRAVAVPPELADWQPEEAAYALQKLTQGNASHLPADSLSATSGSSSDLASRIEAAGDVEFIDYDEESLDGYEDSEDIHHKLKRIEKEALKLTKRAAQPSYWDVVLTNEHSSKCRVKVVPSGGAKLSDRPAMQFKLKEQIKNKQGKYLTPAKYKDVAIIQATSNDGEQIWQVTILQGKSKGTVLRSRSDPDYAGRVVYKSKKNMQLVYDSKGTDKVAMQFGRVSNGIHDQFNLDVAPEGPLTNIQAMGVALAGFDIRWAGRVAARVKSVFA